MPCRKYLPGAGIFSLFLFLLSIQLFVPCFGRYNTRRGRSAESSVPILALFEVGGNSAMGSVIKKHSDLWFGLGFEG